MEKIIVTNKTKNKEIKSKLKEQGVYFSEYTSRSDLFKLVKKHNEGLSNDLDLDIPKIKEVKPPKVKAIPLPIIEDLLTGDQYCSISRQNNGIRFFVNKKFGDSVYTKKEWEVIFKKERIN